MKLTRRAMLGAVGAASAAPVLAKVRKRRPRVVAKVLPEPVVGPFEDIADKLLGHLPEIGCYNGTLAAMDGGPLARKLDDYSPAGEAALRAAYQAARDLLARIRFKGDANMPARLATVSAILENGTRSAAVPYGRINALNFSGHIPYLVTQIGGPHIDSVNIMMEQQSLSTASAVDAWLAKLDDFPRAFAGVAEKLREDAATGSRPPRVLLEKALPVFDAFQAGKAENHVLIQALARRMGAAGLSQGMRALAIARATASLEKQVRPAFAKLRVEVAAMVEQGQSEAGLWAQPGGEEFYAANVRTLGDTDKAPNQIHQIGVDEAARISAEMNALLVKQGLTKGSIGERMAALAKDPINLFADSDAGRAALLDYARAKLHWAEASYAKLLPAAMIPRQALMVKRVPIATQDGAAGGFYDGPSLDGTRPGIYWINLRDIASVPRFRLPTLCFHEGVPGHHTQVSIAAGLVDAPMLSRIASFNAYQEGWALYSERLMAERGAYRNDPLGNLGRLQDELFRATRLVIDTGIHAKRWSREKAIAEMIGITGVASGRVTAEVERYMAWPGQALGYKLGQMRLLEMRRKWIAKHGNARDLRGFHAIVLGQGAMPLDVVEGRLG